MQNNSTKFSLIARLICCTIAGLIISGCATIGGKPTFTRTLAADARVISSDKIRTEIASNPQVAVASFEKERFAQKIDAAIRARVQAGKRPGRDYKIVVNLTKYKKGNAFARAMMAGLGSIHIEANISLYSMPAKKLEGQFSMEKTFTWGGIYGGVTNIEDVEEEFAKSLAEAICTPKPH